MRDEYRVEYRIAALDRWFTWALCRDKEASLAWARLLLTGHASNSERITETRVVTITEHFEIVHPEPEATDG